MVHSWPEDTTSQARVRKSRVHKQRKTATVSQPPMDNTSLSDADAFSHSDLSEAQLMTTSQTPLVSRSLPGTLQSATVPLQLLPSLRHPSSLLALWYHRCHSTMPALWCHSTLLPTVPRCSPLAQPQRRHRPLPPTKSPGQQSGEDPKSSSSVYQPQFPSNSCRLSGTPALCWLSGITGATALCQLSGATALCCPQSLAALHWLNLRDATDHYHPPSLQDNKVEKIQKSSSAATQSVPLQTL